MTRQHIETATQDFAAFFYSLCEEFGTGWQIDTGFAAHTELSQERRDELNAGLAQAIDMGQKMNVNMYMLADSMKYEYEKEQAERNESFQVHGHYCESNAGGYEVEISSDGESARLRDAFGSDQPATVTDWLPIITTDYNGDDESDDVQVIDPHGYDIPLGLVMRA